MLGSLFFRYVVISLCRYIVISLFRYIVISLCRYFDISIFRYSGNSKVKEHFIVKMFGR